jgi:omega-amidase
MATLKVALGEYDTGWHDPRSSVVRAAHVIRRAALDGADLVVLPEMCTTGFTMNAERFAEPLGGPSMSGLADLARTYRIFVIAGAPTREFRAGNVVYCNSALVFDRDGELITHYRKQRLFNVVGEDDVYTAGSAPVIVDMEGVRVAPLICFDLRYPELFRSVARDVHAFAVLANWPAARALHWNVLTQARAIENQCYVIGVNRSGDGGGVDYHGGSVAFGPSGERLAGAQPAQPVTVDSSRVHAVRVSFNVLGVGEGTVYA